jgi:hypothetical protein
VAAGALLASAGPDTFVGINLPRTVAVTHALIVGWLATSIMGATYQLAPAVFGGPLLSMRLARLQFALHVAAVPLFVWALLGWHLTTMGVAGTLVLASIVLYVANVGVSLARGGSRSLPRVYLAVSLGFLSLAIALGITWVGALQPSQLWFPVTLTRLSAHAHLGLVGWLAVAIMGTAYQLVPMFNVVNHAKPRFGWWALALTGAATLLFASAIVFDPPAAARPVLALLLAAGPLLWGADQLRLMRSRSRRRLDVQGRATFVSLAFLALAAALAVGAAFGTPFTTGEEPARWLLAYGAAGILGFAGSTLVGNSAKILPFLIWLHRYQPRAGREPVPLVADIYSDRGATALLAVLASGVLLLLGAALAGNLDLLRAGGVVLVLAGVGHEILVLHMFLPKRASRAAPAAAHGVVVR